MDALLLSEGIKIKEDKEKMNVTAMNRNIYKRVCHCVSYSPYEILLLNNDEGKYFYNVEKYKLCWGKFSRGSIIT